MKRGEVWWVSFDPAIGSEVQKTRPAVIISNDRANAVASIIQVVPLTTTTRKFYPGEAPILFKGKNSKAMANQIRSVSPLRLKNKIGSVALEDMQAIEHAVKIQLDLR